MTSRQSWLLIQLPQKTQNAYCCWLDLSRSVSASSTSTTKVLGSAAMRARSFFGRAEWATGPQRQSPPTSYRTSMRGLHRRRDAPKRINGLTSRTTQLVIPVIEWPGYLAVSSGVR